MISTCMYEPSILRLDNRQESKEFFPKNTCSHVYYTCPSNNFCVFHLTSTIIVECHPVYSGGPMSTIHTGKPATAMTSFILTTHGLAPHHHPSIHIPSNPKYDT